MKINVANIQISSHCNLTLDMKNIGEKSRQTSNEKEDSPKKMSKTIKRFIEYRRRKAQSSLAHRAHINSWLVVFVLWGVAPLCKRCYLAWDPRWDFLVPDGSSGHPTSPQTWWFPPFLQMSVSFSCFSEDCHFVCLLRRPGAVQPNGRIWTCDDETEASATFRRNFFLLIYLSISH